MNKSIVHKHFLLLILITLLVSCIGYHRISKNENGERVLNDKVQYKFNYVPSKEDLNKIDTSAYYVQVFEGRYYNNREKENPMVLIFHNDGYFKSSSVLYHSKFDKTKKNSINYGGKYKLSDNLIELEEFYPFSGGRTNYYSRNIRSGKIEGDRIIFDDGLSLLTIYKKKYKLK